MLLVSLIFALLLTAMPAKAEIPIVAYYGIPLSESTPARFLELKEAGFDMCIEYYGKLPAKSIADILNVASKCGIRLIVNSDLLETKPKEFISVLKGHKGLYAYCLKDEPRPSEMNKMLQKAQNIRRYDTETKLYMNLLPNYSQNMIRSFGIESYDNYVRSATVVPTSQLSFDYYPVTTSGIRDTWYQNLELYRKESLRLGKPFWAFVLSTSHSTYPQPTEAMLRLQIYVNLAYGAQGLQYFTFRTPASSAKYKYVNGPISLDGKRTATYDVVKKVNNEARGILPLFDGAEIISVQHLQKVPYGTTQMRYAPTNIQNMSVNGKEGALVTLMKKDGHQYMVVVNKDYKRKMKLNLTTMSNSVVRITKTLGEEKVSNKYSIPGGDMMIFRLQ